MAAKGVLSEKGGFEVHYGRGADREQVLSFHLSLPPQEKMFLLSPPPSPPEGWKPLYEVCVCAASHGQRHIRCHRSTAHTG